MQASLRSACTYTQMHAHARCTSTDNLPAVTVQSRCASPHMPSKKVSTYLRYSKGTKQWIGGKRIITLTGWTHPLHTNAKRKCVSILASIPETRMRATGTSNTVTKGDGNSRPVGSKRRDREDVVDVAVPTCPARKLVHT